MDKDNLKEKLKEIPNKPGIYYFKNKSGEIIYIGKALSLKVRVKSYFLKSASWRTQDQKTQKLVSQINSLDYLIVNSEIEALLLEAKLIREHQPQYNIQHKDGKRYLYIAVFLSPFPRLNIVRRVDLNEKIDSFYGPFPSGNTAREVLKIIRRIFPFCSCKTLPKKQCFYSHLNLCPGIENLNSPEYRQNITRIKKFLSGQTKTLIKSLEKEMRRESKKNKFEKAKILRDKISSIAYITQGWKRVPREEISSKSTLESLRELIIKHERVDPLTLTKIEGYDVSSLGKDIIVGSMVAFLNAQPEKSLYRKFNIKIFQATQNDAAAIKQIITRRLKHQEWLYPQLILVDGGKPQAAAAFAALKEKNLQDQIAILGLAKKQELIIAPRLENGQLKSFRAIKLKKDSEVLKLLQQIRDESHRFAQKYYKSLHRKQTLLS
ncbi:MAG: GIY-YIG nuclease family protein [Candidatus Shapirobacteria bacterium]